MPFYSIKISNYFKSVTAFCGSANYFNVIMWPSPTFYKIHLAAQILPCFFCKKKRAEVKEKESPPDPPGPWSSGRPNPAAHLPRAPPSSLFTRPSDRARWSPPNPVAVPVGEGIRATSPRPLGLPAPTHSPWTPPLPLSL